MFWLQESVEIRGKKKNRMNNAYFSWRYLLPVQKFGSEKLHSSWDQDRLTIFVNRLRRLYRRLRKRRRSRRKRRAEQRIKFMLTIRERILQLNRANALSV